ncbi:MAG: hypothetical protein U0V49_06210 [Saprospiraceae bacterium]
MMRRSDKTLNEEDKFFLARYNLETSVRDFENCGKTYISNANFEAIHIPERLPIQI